MMEVRRNASRNARVVRQLFFLSLALLGGGTADATQCGTGTYPFPYTDVAGVNDAFCPGIMEAYVTGVSKGTTATTFSPSVVVDRTQMTTFLQRSLDQGLRRSSPRAALNQWWTSTDVNAMQSVASNGNPENCVSDGEHIYVANTASGTVTQFVASTGKIVGTWTGNPSGGRLFAAAGRVFSTTSNTNPGQLYVIDPSQPPGAMVAATTGFGNGLRAIAFDGAKLWVTNGPSPATGNAGVTIVTLQPSMPYPTVTVNAGLGDLGGIAYDGKNIWVGDRTTNALHKLDAAGAVLQTVPLSARPGDVLYDGANLWVTHGIGLGSITVVQASSGAIVGTIAADATNGFNSPQHPSFDGERIIVPSYFSDSVALFKAADMSFIAKVSTSAASGPTGTCSDGLNFWITLSDQQRVVRF